MKARSCLGAASMLACIVLLTGCGTTGGLSADGLGGSNGLLQFFSGSSSRNINDLLSAFVSNLDPGTGVVPGLSGVNGNDLSGMLGSTDSGPASGSGDSSDTAGSSSGGDAASGSGSLPGGGDPSGSGSGGTGTPPSGHGPGHDGEAPDQQGQNPGDPDLPPP